MFRNRIRIETDLMEKVKTCASLEGYATTEEFVTRVLEKEIARILGSAEGKSEEETKKQLRGLGYIE